LPSAIGDHTAGTDVYDFENRLIVRTQPDGTQICVSYDADGNRFQKTILDSGLNPVRATYYLVDTNNPTGYSQVLEEQVVTGGATPTTTLHVYTYGSDLISRTDVDASSSLLATHYYAYDGHGSVRQLTDESGTVTDTYDYDAFGVHLRHTGSSDNAYLYCGEQWDADLGLYFNRARYLNPDSGRFWTMDSYEGKNTDPASLHKYLYAQADPVMSRDPSGQDGTLVEVGEAGMADSILNGMAVAAYLGAQVMLKTWTIWAGAEWEEPHAYIVAVHCSGRRVRYDVDVGNLAFARAKRNPFRTVEGKIIVSDPPQSTAVTILRIPVARLSDLTYRLWSAQFVGIPDPWNGYEIPFDYSYLNNNCVKVTGIYSAKAAVLGLLPF
jgi:RHS repeat-associated protein